MGFKKRLDKFLKDRFTHSIDCEIIKTQLPRCYLHLLKSLNFYFKEAGRSFRKKITLCPSLTLLFLSIKY